MAKLLDMVMGVNGEILVISDKYRLDLLLNSSLTALVVSLNLVLIPTYGMEGAALAALVSLLLFNLAKFILLKSQYNFTPFSGKTVVGILLGVVAYSACKFLPIDNVWLQTITSYVVIILLFFLPMYFLKLSEELNQLINKILKVRKN